MRQEEERLTAALQRAESGLQNVPRPLRAEARAALLRRVGQGLRAEAAAFLAAAPSAEE